MHIRAEIDQPSILKTESPKEMLSVRQVGEKTYVKVNSSSLDVMQSCWRKAHYLLERGLKENLEKPATLFGSAIHKALEVYYSAPRQERVIPTHFEKNMELLAATGELVSQDVVYRAAKAFMDKAQPLKNLHEANKRSLENGIYLLMTYFKQYESDPFVVMQDDQGPMVERTFEIPLYDDEILHIDIFGTIDLVLKNEQTGTILITDHKTSSIMGNDFYARLKPNHQYTIYLMGAQRALGLNTDSFMVNGLQVKERPKTSRGGPPTLIRQITTRDENDMLELTHTLIQYVAQYLGNRQVGFWPLGPVMSCTAYGACQYQEVCSSPKQIRENIIKARFSETKQQGVLGATT